MWLTCSRERGTGEKAKDYPDVGRYQVEKYPNVCRLQKEAAEAVGS